MKLPSRLLATPWLTVLSGFVLAALLALTLALFGWFFPILTLLTALFLFGGFAIAIIGLVRANERTHLAVIGGLSLFAAIIVSQTEPTVFTGRDQGSIALAAVELAKGHELAFRSAASDAFFTIYGPGRALNFPGFAYTETGALITQFPLGYISYLGLFVSWFGTTGLAIANGFLFVLSGWTFFELGLLFVSRRNVLLGTALFATSFLTIWLTQMTLTENLALLIFLALSLALVRLDRDEDSRFLPLIILLGFLFAMTRIEGFVIAPLALLYILYRPALRARLFALPKRWLIPTLFFLAFLFLRDLFMNLPFYTMIGKAVLKYWHEVSSVAGDESNDPSLGPILISYGLFAVFLGGIASLAFGIMKRRFTLLIPVLLALPTFIYLVNGHISDDHPWLLRRYAFTLFPLFLLAMVALWQSIEETLTPTRQRLFGIFSFGLLFALQIVPSFTALTTAEYHMLKLQASGFAERFDDRDLVLIDRGVTGDPFAMIAGPLASIDRKNAAYFFNPEDYARLDRSGFEHVYLLATEDSLGRYADAFGNDLLPVEVVSFSHPVLTAPAPYRLPVASTITSDAILFEITK